MTKKLIARSEITIHAPASRVWDALTDPKLIKQYLFGTQVVSDWKVGSPLVFKGKWKGRTYKDKGKILQMEPKKLLQYTFWSSLSGVPDIPENYYKVSFRLSHANGRTLLSVSQNGVATEKERVESRKNWAMVLHTMKELLEK
jgi:uncharacterized protein YndB with AHSA1/START domain